jgi:hypothetical protein
MIYLLSPLTLLSQQIQDPKKSDSVNYFSITENDPVIKRMVKGQKFYDSILTKQNFHTRFWVNLTNGRFLDKDGRFKDKDVRFRFKTDRGYVVSNGSVTTQPSGNPSDFIGGNIHPLTRGKHFVVLLYFLYCVGESVHGCTNYSVTLELPKLQTGAVVDLSSSEVTALLGYWHFGSFSGSVSSISSSGNIKIKSFDGGIVKGSLEISFNNSDQTGFTMSGQFVLPVINYSLLDQFNQGIEK